MCLNLGIDPILANKDGRTALHGAADKGRNAVVQLLVDRGAKLDAHDNGSRDTFTGALFGHTWMPEDYARGLVRVGVQSAIAHPETEALLKKLMEERGNSRAASRRTNRLRHGFMQRGTPKTE
ncbi:MAG TPA: ankyrin repeat domain-containing protein [Bryobacteraceae bacterium]